MATAAAPMEPSKWVEEMESLMAHPAWHIFVDDIEGYKEALRDSWESHKSPESYHFARGRASAFEQVIGLEQLVQQAKDSLKAATIAHAEEQYDAENV